MRCTVFVIFYFIVMLLIVKMLTFLIKRLKRFPLHLCVLMYVYPKFEKRSVQYFSSYSELYKFCVSCGLECIKNSGQSDIKNIKSSEQVYMRSWYGLCHCLFKVRKVFTDRLCHQSTSAPTQPKRNSKALQCPV